MMHAQNELLVEPTKFALLLNSNYLGHNQLQDPAKFSHVQLRFLGNIQKWEIVSESP